ncbi:type I signal peptidase [Plasmodium reichenowi]|uniref:Type I signal peptidase n=1 Tax=Plasmodium reichenowi TaxID=5854 RepID=A0A151L6P3_PLARE|nr:type I signal peptidase [Plasmodium reichenowi]KYN94645.1 type I signal peptidase [Plasmodium reichenowi]
MNFLIYNCFNKSICFFLRRDLYLKKKNCTKVSFFNYFNSKEWNRYEKRIRKKSIILQNDAISNKFNIKNKIFCNKNVLLLPLEYKNNKQSQNCTIKIWKRNKNGYHIGLRNKKGSKKNSSNNNNNNNKRKKINFFSRIEPIKDFLKFTKKIVLCCFVIYGINNYIFDMTLTSGSSMYPLINQNGVILFYVCDYSLRWFNNLKKIYLSLYMNILYKCYNILQLHFDYEYTSYLYEIIYNKINNLKNKIKKCRHIYKRGDVVLLVSPVNEKKRVCKRIIAIENDKLFIDNFHSYVEIPQNNIWVEGDNQMDSYDSRNYGSVHVQLIIGKVFFLLDPFKEFAFVNSERNYKPDLRRYLHISN